MIFILVNVEIDLKASDISIPMQSAVTDALKAWQADLVNRHTRQITPSRSSQAGRGEQVQYGVRQIPEEE